jgi:GxxExxY protein
VLGVSQQAVSRTLTRWVLRTYNVLGYGFSEKVYQNALVIELLMLGLRAECQKQIPVYYAGQLVGEYFADILVNGVVMLELKVAQRLLDEHEAQLLNCLKITPVEVGLLLNFGSSPTFKRKVYDNDRKGSLAWMQAG